MFQPGFDEVACNTFVGTAESMTRVAMRLVTSVTASGAASVDPQEVVGLCKEFVGLTRTLDATLEGLMAKAPQGEAQSELGLCKSSSKRAVHALLKAVKEAQGASGVTPALATEMEEASQSLRRGFSKAKQVLERPLEKKAAAPLAAAAAPAGSVDSPASQRFAALKKQAAAVKDAKVAGGRGASVAAGRSALGQSVATIDMAEGEEEEQAAKPSSRPLLQHMKTSPGGLVSSGASLGGEKVLPDRLSKFLGPLDADRTRLLIEQMDCKCRWLEDELYRTTELHVALHIVQAQNLSPLDPNGKSDPYCVVPNVTCSSGAAVRTKMVPETLDPVWDETFEFRLTSAKAWSFRVELLDFDSDTVSKPLGFVDLHSSDWALTSRERKKWLPVQGGSGSIYVGLKLAKQLGMERVEGDRYRCDCCLLDDIPDLFACERCNKQTCALCIGLFLCDACREDLCKRARKDTAVGTAAQSAATVAAVGPSGDSEYAAAQRAATLIDVADWKNERYEWKAWSAALGDKPADAKLLVVPKSYGVEWGTDYNGPLQKETLDLTMLDPFETYPHYTAHLIRSDHAIFLGSTPGEGAAAVPVVVVCEKLSYSSAGEQRLRALVYSPDGTVRHHLDVQSGDLGASESGGGGGGAAPLRRTAPPGASKSFSTLSVASNAPAFQSSKNLTVGAAAGKVGGGGGAAGADLRGLLLEKYAGLSLRRVPSAAHEEVAGKLLEFERNHTDLNRRVGVLFVPKGVREENAVFKSTGSPDLYEFMDMLAERVRLQGWSKYAGGLNTQNNSTGLESYYTEFLGFNIMFHVNSLLEDDGSEQQLSRKRFIGNDLVVIVFVEGDEPFDASMITSQMCHTFIVVKKVASKPTRYRVAVVAKPSVPAFTPVVPCPGELDKSDKLRQFLLTKALNANRATFQAKTFLQKTRRTRRDLLARMLKDLTDEGVLAHSPDIVMAPDKEPPVLALCADNVALKATADFIAEDATFLSLRAGDVVTAVSANPSDVYWTGVLNGRVGRFPAANVELAVLHKRPGLALLGKAGASSRALTATPSAPAGNVLYRLRFYQGKAMSVCDPWGTSDPYCTVSSVRDVSGKAIRTKVHQRTLNPEWHQAFEFYHTNPFSLRVEVWDKDLVGTDDAMGYVDILSSKWNLTQPNAEDVRWLPMVDGDGEIQLGLTLLSGGAGKPALERGQSKLV